MTSRTTRMAAALGLACTLLTAACSDDFSLTEPISAPAYSQNQDGDGSGSWGSGSLSTQSSGSDSWSSESSTNVSSTTGGNEGGNEGNGLVESDLVWTTTTASAVIGRDGGTVTLYSGSVEDEEGRPSHRLRVPRGAVKRPTRFVMEVGPDPTIDVHLSATEVSSGQPITEFRKALELRLTYEGLAAGDPNLFKIVHVVDGIVSEVVASTVDTAKRVIIGEIWHFSRYAVACE